MRFVNTFVFGWMLCGTCLAQDALQRVEQFLAEAEQLNLPSCVLFDATRIVSSERKSKYVQTRSIGRRVVGPNGEIRVDVRVTLADLNSGSERTTFEHFIRFGPKDYLQALRLFGSQLSIHNLEKSLKEGKEPAVPCGFVNPFTVVMRGDSAFNGVVGEFNKKSSIKGMENALKPAIDLKAKVIGIYEFQEKTPWAVTSWKSASNPKQFDPKLMVVKNGRPSEDHLPNWTDVENPTKYVKDWSVFASGSVDWMGVDDFGVLPARLVCQVGGKEDFDDSKRDFEVYYFGYEFDIKPLEKLFDRKRFNDSDIMEDFPIESILDQADAAKKAIADKSSKKANGR